MMRRMRRARFAVLVAVLGCHAALSAGAGTALPRRAIQLTQVQCYIVCDSLRATLNPLASFSEQKVDRASTTNAALLRVTCRYADYAPSVSGWQLILDVSLPTDAEGIKTKAHLHYDEPYACVTVDMDKIDGDRNNSYMRNERRRRVGCALSKHRRTLQCSPHRAALGMLHNVVAAVGRSEDCACSARAFI